MGEIVLGPLLGCHLPRRCELFGLEGSWPMLVKQDNVDAGDGIIDSQQFGIHLFFQFCMVLSALVLRDM